MACGCGGSNFQADGAVPAANIQDDGYFWPPRRTPAATVPGGGSGQWHADDEDDKPSEDA